MYFSQFPIFQWALGSDKKVPAASKVEQDRLREAIRNKEEERKRKRREMKEEAEKKRETKQEASTPPVEEDAEESCCSESDNFSTNSHSQPGYTICKKELSKGSVWDSHCHLDFLARKLRRENIKGGESLAKSLKSDGQHLGEMFGGCIANFCDPRDWDQGQHLSLIHI